MSQADDASLPITRVTLYTSGVGYFERGGDVEGDARLTLLFPVGQVNDVLKSLVLLDMGEGAIQPVTYAARDPASRALQAFSVDISGNPDRAALLNQIRGTSVTVAASDGEALTGVVVGVEAQSVVHEQGVTERHTLNLLADDGLHSLPLSDVRRIAVNDAKLNEELRQALAAVAQGRDANKRPLTLTFSGQGRRRVLVGYVAEAPAWQTTYRLVLGDKPLLQGWALVQNTGQEDWDDARLTLVSGRPVSFIQDLYTPLYVHRPTVQPRIPASPTPQTYDSDLMDMRMHEPVYGGIDYAPAEAAIPPAGVSRLRQAKVAAAAPAAPRALASLVAERPAQQSLASTGAQLGTSLFAYHIDVPVSIPRQQSAMIPFTASDVQAEQVSVFNAQVQPDHPLSGVRLKNTTSLHLMGGPLTVFREGEGGAGYIGDALMDDTEPGQTRLLTYAIDLAVDAAHEQDTPEQTIRAATVTGGVLAIRRTLQRLFRYTFKNHAGVPRTVIVEHPYPGDEWRLLEPATPAERTAQFYRFEMAVTAGASCDLSVHLERATEESVTLLDADLDWVLFYSRTDNISPAIQAALTDISRRRRALADNEAEADDIDERREEIGTEQARIRQNMQNLEYKSDLYKRYVAELDAQETQIKDLQARREALRVEQAAAQAALNEFIAGLNLS